MKEMVNKWLFSLFFGLMLFNKCGDCDCGRPNRPTFGGHDRQQNYRFKEDSVVNYWCNHSFKLVFEKRRVCKFGVWSGRPVVCVEPIVSDVYLKRIIIFSDEITKDYNISDKNIVILNSKNNEKCISSDSLVQQNWTLILSQPKVINYITVKLKNNPFGNNSNVGQSVRSLLINKSEPKMKRMSKLCHFMNFTSNNELEFLCFISKTEKQNDVNHRSDEILLIFADLLDSVSICGLSIYRFPRNCGKYGFPLEMNIEEIIEGIELESSCSDGYHLIGSSKILCSSDGQWMENPECKPITSCSLIEPINKFDKRVARIEYKNGFYFNKSLVAINETDAIHYCLKTNITNNRNKSFSRNVLKYVRQCENGVWSEADTDCDTLLIDNPNVEFQPNNYFSIIITMILMIVMFSILTIGSYFILKYNNRRKRTLKERTEKVRNQRNLTKYTNNRLSDPFDDSVYSIVAEDSYDIINFDANQLNSCQYDDTQIPKPFYLEILPLSRHSSDHSFNQSISSSF